MSSSEQKRLVIIIFLVLCVAAIALLINSCITYSSKSYLEKYERMAKVSTVRNNYKITTMFVSNEYQVCLRERNAQKEYSKEEFSQLREKYSKSINVILELEKQDLKDSGMNYKNDLLYSSLGKGQASFRERLNLFNSGIKEHIRLVVNDTLSLLPIYLHYQRRWQAGTTESFMIMFPKKYRGELINIRESKIEIREFGFATGKVVHKVIQPRILLIKV